jgi:hypothetical protein
LPFFLFVMVQGQISQELICPCCYTLTSQQTKEAYCCPLSKEHKGWFYRLMSQIGKQHEITNQCPCLSLMQASEGRSTIVRFVQIRQSCQGCKYQSNSGHSCQFIRDTTQDGIDPEEVPFWHNVSRGRVRVCRNIVVRVSQQFRIKAYLISSSQAQYLSSYQILRVKVRIKIYQIGLSINTQRICRSILMQCSKVNQAQSSLQEGKKVMEAVETIQGRIIYTETTPLPSYNTGTYYRQSTCQTSNYSPSPKRHLTPRLYISDKGGQNHNQLDHNSNQPYKFTRLCITSVIQTTEKVHVNNDKKQTCSVSVQITQHPSIGYVTHQVLNTMKSQVNMCSIMHCQENTGPDLQNLAQSSLYTPIIISILIRRCRVPNQMVLYHSLNGLIPQTSAQFFHRSCHLEKNKLITF